jgi:hypothetical protein
MFRHFYMPSSGGLWLKLCVDCTGGFFLVYLKKAEESTTINNFYKDTTLYVRTYIRTYKVVSSVHVRVIANSEQISAL